MLDDRGKIVSPQGYSDNLVFSLSLVHIRLGFPLNIFIGWENIQL